MENGLHGHLGQVAVLTVEVVKRLVSDIAQILDHVLVEDFVKDTILKKRLAMSSHVLMVSLVFSFCKRVFLNFGNPAEFN
jgi:hypothetical protein